MRWAVEPGDDGARLDVVLARWLDTSRSRAAARITAGEVRVGGEPVTKRRLLRTGEVVEVSEPTPATPAPPPELPPVRFEDDDLLVVAKPAGLVTHPGAGHATDTLVDALRAAGVDLAPAGGASRPGIVHRLDRDTSGLMVVAKSDAAHHGLVTALQQRRVRRGYVAVVRGVPSAERGRIDAPIGRDPHHRTRYAVTPSGREAVTRYHVTATAEVALDPPVAVAVLACRLHTGRTHQIRVHLAAIGHGIVGDAVYGTTGGVARAMGLKRPFLHAAVLAFNHPVSGEPIHLVEPLGDDLAAAAGRAGLPVALPEAALDGLLAT